MPTHTLVPREWRRPVVEYSEDLLAKVKHTLGRTLGVEANVSLLQAGHDPWSLPIMAPNRVTQEESEGTRGH